MTQDTRTARCAAIAAGTLILAASAYAVIHAGHQDLPHAILTGSLAVGVLAGSAIVGSVWAARRVTLALAIGIALLAGEGFNLLMTADRIVAEREDGQSRVRSAQGAHEHATNELVKAQGAFEAAQRATITEAAKPGCKRECNLMLAGAVAATKLDLDRARGLYAANPAPTASGSPLADRLGVPAWAVDLTVAALLSLGANGLAAALIAYGAHNRVAQAKPARVPAKAASEPTPPKGGRKTRKADAEAVVLQMRRPATQDELAARFGVTKAAVSQWCADWERRGLISRTQEGRQKLVAARHPRLAAVA